ncbi:MAG: hypothetical protein Q8O88_03875 [bacterium]|nr:hypothetical protein [bacterium]
MTKKEISVFAVLDDIHFSINKFYEQWDEGNKTAKQTKQFLTRIKKKLKNF